MQKEKVKNKCTVLFQGENKDITNILSLYKTDKEKALILIKSEPARYIYFEEVMFENENGDFHIIAQRKRIQISSNNKMYFTSFDKQVFLYKNKKFWLLAKNSRVRALSLTYLNSTEEDNRILNIFFQKFPWIKLIFNSPDVRYKYTLFNTIVKHNLYNYNAYLKFAFKTILPTAKLFSDYSPKRFKFFKQNSINIDNINPEFIEYHTQSNAIFRDSIRLASILNEKVNCKWSSKRLKQEHDKWSKKITLISLEGNNRTFDIKQEFVDFAKWSGYKLLTTSTELAMEGLKQSHCVASYSTLIDQKLSAILSIEEYTAEIKFNGLIYLNQFNGFSNSTPPQYLLKQVTDKISEFNVLNGYEKIIPKDEILTAIWLSNHLPLHKTSKLKEGWEIEMEYKVPYTEEVKTIKFSKFFNEREARLKLYNFIEKNNLFPKTFKQKEEDSEWTLSENDILSTNPSTNPNEEIATTALPF